MRAAAAVKLKAKPAKAEKKSILADEELAKLPQDQQDAIKTFLDAKIK
ncbi:MAG: hypothetical protein IT260_22555 [Saprospiraceae bacterium]|nr:hypothetical protein [Saprospiraceae bacterium]